jgi:LCP family protein required for cell wall assembly
MEQIPGGWKSSQEPHNNPLQQIYRPINPSGRINRNFARPSREGQGKTIFKLILTLILFFGVAFILYFSEKFVTDPQNPLLTINRFNPLSRLVALVTGDDKRLEGVTSDRINFLLMGIGGEGHDGPYLTDTIIVASLKPSTNEIAMMSLPRDLAVKNKKGYLEKINQIYSDGRQAGGDETGLENITATVETFLDTDINYYALIDFSGFEKFIDELGGITVNVPKGFTDNLYPTDDFKNTVVSFQAGSQLMSGKRALIYARSRHGDNYEGSDFARSRRQQLILQAVKDKLFSFNTLIDPQRIAALMDLVNNSLKTNLSFFQAVQLSDILKNVADDKIYNLTIDDGPFGMLNPDYLENGAWILKPRPNAEKIIAGRWQNIFDTSGVKSENAVIEVANGTTVEGMAYFTAETLKQLGYSIATFGNAVKQDFEKTVIYDLSNNTKPITLKLLSEEFQVKVSNDLPPEFLAKYQDLKKPVLQPEILIVLGLDQMDRLLKPLPPKTASGTDATLTATTSTSTLFTLPFIDDIIPTVKE